MENPVARLTTDNQLWCAIFHHEFCDPTESPLVPYFPKWSLTVTIGEVWPIFTALYKAVGRFNATHGIRIMFFFNLITVCAR